ncbi:hypothetical protein DSUL_60013 [Desulfovibrionales bacterium]
MSSMSLVNTADTEILDAVSINCKITVFSLNHFWSDNKSCSAEGSMDCSIGTFDQKKI